MKLFGHLPKMEFLRSEEMSFVQFIIPFESAHRAVTYLGDLGVVQFNDVSYLVFSFHQSTFFIRFFLLVYVFLSSGLVFYDDQCNLQTIGLFVVSGWGPGPGKSGWAVVGKQRKITLIGLSMFVFLANQVGTSNQFWSCKRWIVCNHCSAKVTGVKCRCGHVEEGENLLPIFSPTNPFFVIYLLTTFTDLPHQKKLDYLATALRCKNEKTYRMGLLIYVKVVHFFYNQHEPLSNDHSLHDFSVSFGYFHIFLAKRNIICKLLSCLYMLTELSHGR